jgi:hypothetical protein
LHSAAERAGGGARRKRASSGDRIAAIRTSAFVVDLGVETTVDLDVQKAASDLDELALGEQSEVEVP